MCLELQCFNSLWKGRMQLMAALWKCLKRSYNPALHTALGVNRISIGVRMSQPLLRSYQYRQTAAARHLAWAAQK